MERLFEPKTEKEAELVKTIKNNRDRISRKKALQSLLILNGFEKSELYAIRSIEYYDGISNKPSAWKKFRSASVVYDDCRVTR
jgi:hypothetical protein